MRIGRVVGTVTLNRNHAAMRGARYRLVVPLSLSNLRGESPAEAAGRVEAQPLGQPAQHNFALTAGVEPPLVIIGWQELEGAGEQAQGVVATAYIDSVGGGAHTATPLVPRRIACSTMAISSAPLLPPGAAISPHARATLPVMLV